MIPRGVRFSVQLLDDSARGYMLENFGAALRLPELGPIGSNCLANARDFKTPVAWYEDVEGDFELIAKFTGGFWRAAIGHSPLDVVAWHGTHAPYKYDLRHFNTIGSISYDHPDPSIFTVLTARPIPGHGQHGLRHLPAAHPGNGKHLPSALVPPQRRQRIHGPDPGRVRRQGRRLRLGGASLHNCMSGHGPDAETFEKASRADTSSAHYIRDTMAFMFETRRVIRPTAQALASVELQGDYYRCWQGLQKHFDPAKA